MNVSTAFGRGSAVCVAAWCTAALGPAHAAPINYGDFSDIPPGSVMYLDVTETANQPDDTEPLYGPPTILGDKLDFDPGGFVASATNGAADLTDGQLNFTLMSLADGAIEKIIVTERGDYTLQGTGTAATLISYALGLSSLTVLEVDGVPLASPVLLPSASASGGDNLGNGVDVLSPWSLGLTYDVAVALDAAGVAHTRGVTKLEVVIDNSLTAISEVGTVASIAKKDFMIDHPEPATAALLALGLLAIHNRRR